MKRLYGLFLYLRSLLFLLGIAVFTLVIGVVSLFTVPLPLRLRYLIITRWSHWVIWWARVACGIKYRITGQEHVPSGPVIILSNHQSAWEGIFYQVYFPELTWVLKKELLRIPFFGWALALVKPIAIDRSKRISALDQLIKQGRKNLQNGRWVVIFPEGTRSMPGKLKKFSLGGAALAAATGYPVLPIAHNAGEFWPPNQIVKKPGTVEVVIGPVIQSQGRTAKEINAIAREWIERVVTSRVNSNKELPPTELAATPTPVKGNRLHEG